jgi:hypothetical protein
MKKYIILTFIVLTSKLLIAQKKFEWINTICYSQVKIGIINHGYSKDANGYLWGITIKNVSNRKLQVAYSLAVGGEAYAKGGYQVTRYLAPGESWTEGESLFTGLLFKNASWNYKIDLKDLCYEGDDCYKDGYVNCDGTRYNAHPTSNSNLNNEKSNSNNGNNNNGNNNSNGENNQSNSSSNNSNKQLNNSSNKTNDQTNSTSNSTQVNQNSTQGGNQSKSRNEILDKIVANFKSNMTFKTSYNGTIAGGGGTELNNKTITNTQSTITEIHYDNSNIYLTLKYEADGLNSDAYPTTTIDIADYIIPIEILSTIQKRENNIFYFKSDEDKIKRYETIFVKGNKTWSTFPDEEIYYGFDKMNFNYNYDNLFVLINELNNVNNSTGNSNQQSIQQNSSSNNQTTSLENSNNATTNKVSNNKTNTQKEKNDKYKTELKKTNNTIETDLDFERSIIENNNLAKSKLTTSMLIQKAEEFYNNKQYQNSVEYYEAAAIRGNINAMHECGSYYRGFYMCNGVSCVELNYPKSRFWLKKAAQKGDESSMLSLGFLCMQGNDVSVDYDKAKEWFKMAADKGDAWGMYHIGNLYKSGGNGLQKDVSKAREWFAKACKAGHKDACDEEKKL